MLDATSSRAAHILQNVALLVLGIIFLPLTSSIVCVSLILRQTSNPRQDRVSRPDIQKTILVTGVGMTKGLTLARSFHKAGHRVIGADFEPEGALCPGRFSSSLAAFFRLQKPSPTRGSAAYVQGLLNVIQAEKVDLWVSCSGVASAVEDGEAKEIVENRTQCKAIQFDVATTQTLHEKHTFIHQVRKFGLTAPETHTITASKPLQETLRNAPAGRRYIMKPIGMDDAARGDMTLLPKPSWEDTLTHIHRLKISEKSPWILQQYVQGEEFCTHALVVNGDVKAFVSCPSSELLMYYEALPEDSALNKAMLQFTQKFASRYGQGFTGHLSFDFLVEDSKQRNPNDILLYPIECNPRAHTAVVLFEGSNEMVPAYLSLLDQDASADMVVYPVQPGKYYWLGHDLIELLIMPLLGLLSLRTSFAECLGHVREFAVHLIFWMDGTHTLQDPLPFLALYHIYWPMQFLNCIRTGRKWSRLNVSTLKMFEC